MHVKSGQTVTILKGKDKGKSGKILKSFPATGKVVVEGLNIVKVEVKAKKKEQKGQIIDKPMAIDASNVKVKS
jgi:large subunit ribosomal protein L24